MYNTWLYTVVLLFSFLTKHFNIRILYIRSKLLCVYIHAFLNCFCRNVANFSTSLLPLRNACQNCYHWCSV